MKNFLQFNHQDGKVYFKKFRVCELTTYCNENELTVINIDIKSFDGPYSDSEIEVLSRSLGKINNDMSYCWIELRDYETDQEFNELIQCPILFKKGYNINNSMGDSIAHAYFGWSIELNNNRLEFEQLEDGIRLKWSASSSDINYYDDRARDNNFTLDVLLEVHHLEDLKSFRIHEMEKRKREELYFSILRLMSDHAIENDYQYDISSIPRGNSNLENSINAWIHLKDARAIPKASTVPEPKIQATKKRRWWKK